MRTRWLPNTSSPRGFHPKRASWRSLPAPGGCPSLAETPKLFDIPSGAVPTAPSQTQVLTSMQPWLHSLHLRSAPAAPLFASR